MDTQVMNMSNNGRPTSGSQPAYTPHPSTPEGFPLGRPYPGTGPVQPGPGMRPAEQNVWPPRSQPQPVLSQSSVPFQAPKIGHTVEEKHDAFQKAKEALHDRHYEDNDLRLKAEIALAEFFLS